MSDVEDRSMDHRNELSMEERLASLPVPQLATGSHRQTLRAELAEAQAPSQRKPALRPLLVAAAILVASAWLVTEIFVSRPSRALAATVEAVQAAKSLVAETGVPGGRNKVYWKASGWLRIDYDDGGVYDGETWVIHDDEVTVINPQRGTAVVLKNMSDRYRTLVQGVAELAVPEKLTELLRRSATGPAVPGSPASNTLVVPLKEKSAENGRALEMALDAGSHLPLEIRESDGKRVACRYQWNVALADDVFSPALPKGVEARVVDGAKQAAPLPIVPGQGVGPIRLGMSADEVLAALGKPDRILNGIAYQYFEYGLEAVVGKKGVWMVGCLGGDGEMSPFLGFTGTTPEGAGLGSTKEQLVAWYGEPGERRGDEAAGVSVLTYRDRGIEFELHDDAGTKRVTIVRVLTAHQETDGNRRRGR